MTLAPTGDARTFDPARPARLHPLVTLRDEAFGALAYHYGERRLVFVKSPVLVDVLVDLEHHDSARSAVAAHAPSDEVERYLAAVARLFDSGVVDGR
ncbi:MAG TPA: mycofactocin biosynthesis chaperone MftB [Acidimicrobiales bacterium]|nr:mycofactocin biosynthesis chaperone MftB [Acidimicrobiales bacterium]